MLRKVDGGAITGPDPVLKPYKRLKGGADSFVIGFERKGVLVAHRYDIR